MDIREQTYVLAIAQHKNIKGAAEELNISQPGLSIFLSTLEKRIGTPLFHRNGKRFVPTDAGELYLSYARKISEFKHEFDARISDLKKEVIGKLRLGLQVIRSSNVLAASLRQFDENYHNVETEIFEGNNQELLAKLLAGELDFIIVNTKGKNKILNYQPLFKDRLVCILSPNHPAAGCGVKIASEALPYLDLKILDGERFILPHPVLATRKYADMAISYAGALPGRTMVIENLDTIPQLAAEGLGVGFSLFSFIKYFIYPRPISAFLVGSLNVFSTYYIVRRKDRYLPKYALFFIRELERSYSSFNIPVSADLPLHNREPVV